MLKIGVVGVPGGWSSERLADTVEKHTGFRLLIDMEKVIFDFDRDSIFFDNIDLSTLDALIIKKIGPRYSPDLIDRLDLLVYLSEHKGVRCFSDPEMIKRAISRQSNTLILRSGGIPMPPLVITENTEIVAEHVKKWGKAVLKPLFSSKARGMEVLEADEKELKKKVVKFKENGNTSIYVQAFQENLESDLGVAFLGGKYIGTYARVKSDESSWNTTINSGGKYREFDPPEEVLEIADKAQKLFKLDFTSVDVLSTEDGWKVFEVSAFGGFRGLLEASGIDASEEYFKYVRSKLK